MKSAAQMALWLLLTLHSLSAAAYEYKTFPSDGVSIAYTDYGVANGEPVILLHGLNANYEANLGKPGDALSKDFRVIGVDMRGFGRSGKPKEEDAYGAHLATDIIHLMDHLQIQKARLVGHSLGGIVVVYLAANYPQRVVSAVSIGNGLFSSRDLTVIGYLLRGMQVWWDFERWLGISDFVPPYGYDREASLRVSDDLNGLYVSDEQAAAIKLPLLAMRGGPEDDPHDTVERLVSINPSVQTIRIEEADHMTILGNPKFHEGLQAFLLRSK